MEEARVKTVFAGDHVFVIWTHETGARSAPTPLGRSERRSPVRMDRWWTRAPKLWRSRIRKGEARDFA